MSTAKKWLRKLRNLVEQKVRIASMRRVMGPGREVILMVGSEYSEGPVPVIVNMAHHSYCDLCSMHDPGDDRVGFCLLFGEKPTACTCCNGPQRLPKCLDAEDGSCQRWCGEVPGDEKEWGR